MRCLIIGASGQVGQALAAALDNQKWPWKGTCHQHSLPGQSLLPLDIADGPALDALIQNQEPQAVFFPSGWTWVDGCEDDEAKAVRLNAQAPAQAAAAAARLGAAFVHYSTDYVFDGRSGPYDETAEPKPLGAYARSKVLGEKQVLAAHPKALILRTQVVYGPEPQGKNSVFQLKTKLSAGQPMQVPKDQVCNPTYNRDLARASVELVRFGFSGVWNVAGADQVDRMTFAVKAAQTFGLDQSLLKAVTTEELKQKAARPLNAGLDSGKLLRALGWRPRGIEAGLAEMKAVLDW
jgi:dTDP-4-dehydrorhamnose reductase